MMFNISTISWIQSPPVNSGTLGFAIFALGYVGGANTAIREKVTFSSDVVTLALSSTAPNRVGSAAGNGVMAYFRQGYLVSGGSNYFEKYSYSSGTCVYVLWYSALTYFSACAGNSTDFVSQNSITNGNPTLSRIKIKYADNSMVVGTNSTNSSWVSSGNGDATHAIFAMDHNGTSYVGYRNQYIYASDTNYGFTSITPTPTARSSCSSFFTYGIWNNGGIINTQKILWSNNSITAATSLSNSYDSATSSDVAGYFSGNTTTKNRAKYIYSGEVILNNTATSSYLASASSGAVSSNITGVNI